MRLKLKLLFVFTLVVVGLGWGTARASAQEVPFPTFKIEIVETRGTISFTRVAVEFDEELAAPTQEERWSYRTSSNLFGSEERIQFPVTCADGKCYAEVVIQEVDIVEINFSNAARQAQTFVLQLGANADEAGFAGSSVYPVSSDDYPLSGPNKVFRQVSLYGLSGNPNREPEMLVTVALDAGMKIEDVSFEVRPSPFYPDSPTVEITPRLDKVEHLYQFLGTGAIVIRFPMEISFEGQLGDSFTVRLFAEVDGERRSATSVWLEESVQLYAPMILAE